MTKYLLRIQDTEIPLVEDFAYLFATIGGEVWAEWEDGSTSEVEANQIFPMPQQHWDALVRLGASVPEWVTRYNT